MVERSLRSLKAFLKTAQYIEEHIPEDGRSEVFNVLINCSSRVCGATMGRLCYWKVLGPPLLLGIREFPIVTEHTPHEEYSLLNCQ